MNAALAGYAIGMFLAAGGAGYIFLGLLWALRIYKRWPRGSYMAATGLVLLLGAATAMGATDPTEMYVALISASAAAVYVAWRGRLFKTASA